MTTVAALLADLAAARASGFTHDREEHALGVCAIGMSLGDAGQRI